MDSPAYVTAHKNGFQVRLPKRVGGGSKFFTVNSGPGTMAGKSIAMRNALRWRDDRFNSAHQPVLGRAKDNAGVFGVNGEYAVAVWMYEGTQIKRMFSIKAMGEELAFSVAHMAREIGVLAELERLQEEVKEIWKKRTTLSSLSTNQSR
jgi:hypothetical protein